MSSKKAIVSKKSNRRVKGEEHLLILPTQHSETIGSLRPLGQRASGSQRPQGKQEYKDILFKIFKSDYLRNLPQVIAGVVITGLLTKYILFDTIRTETTNAENQTINNLTSNFMHDLFFEDVNNRQIVNNLHEGLSEIDQNLRLALQNARSIPIVDAPQQPKAPYGQHILKKTNSKFLEKL